MSSTINTKYLLPSIAALLLGYGNMGYMECQINPAIMSLPIPVLASYNQIEHLYDNCLTYRTELL